MLNLLTKYLLQYRRVSIPSVGTIRLVPQPAQLSVADKQMLPPGFTAERTEDETISGHQLFFLSAALHKDKSEVLQQLTTLGEMLSARIKSGGFHWKGIGLITDNREPLALSLPALDPVPAERVVRQDASHSVLVGDQEMTSTHLSTLKEEAEVVAKKERSIFVVIGWILLVLSVLYIVFVLYQGKFRVGSTGSKQAPTSRFYFQQKKVQEFALPSGKFC